MLWIKNTDGKPDAVLTMALVGFLTCLAKVLLSNVTVEVMNKTLNFGSIDGSVVAAILTPTLGAYIARRYTDRKFVDTTAQPSPPEKEEA